MDDRLDDTVKIGQDFVIPEAKRQKMHRCERRISRQIPALLIAKAMLLAINLDGEFGWKTGEIEDVSGPWHLSAEMESLWPELT